MNPTLHQRVKSENDFVYISSSVICFLLITIIIIIIIIPILIIIIIIFYRKLDAVYITIDGCHYE